MADEMTIVMMTGYCSECFLQLAQDEEMGDRSGKDVLPDDANSENEL